MRTITVRELLLESVPQLQLAGIDTPLLDAEVLLCEAMGVSRSYLLAHPEQCVPSAMVSRFRQWVTLRTERVPLAYIVGHKEFYGLDFEVHPGLLIPRPETELLVEQAIELLRDVERPVVAEIGLGSGAVAVSIAVIVHEACVYGTDVSSRSVKVTSRNASKHGVSGRVVARHGHLFEPLRGLKFELIVSNPPYVPTSEIEKLQPEVSRYEPREALDGGTDGMMYHREIIREAPAYLNLGGHLLLEVGQGQADAVMSLMNERGYAEVSAVKDYAGIKRLVKGRWSSSEAGG